MTSSLATTPAAGRRRKLTPELIEKVRKLVPSGAPNKTIAAACGISMTAWCRWVQNAKSGSGDALEVEFWKAIQEGRAEGELTHLEKIHGGDSKDSQWLLTHSVHWRHNWSDNAAAQRAVQRQMEGVAAGIEAMPFLSHDQKHDALLFLHARGLGVMLPQQESDAGS